MAYLRVFLQWQDFICLLFIYLFSVFSVKFRDEVGSLPVLVRALDAVLFPPTSSEVNSSADVSATPPLVNTTAAPPIQPATLSESANQTNSSGEKVVVADEASASASESEVKSKCEQTSEKTFSAREYVLPEPLSENQCALVNELLKVIFNQTVTWKNGENMAEVREGRGGGGGCVVVDVKLHL